MTIIPPININDSTQALTELQTQLNQQREVAIAERFRVIEVYPRGEERSRLTDALQVTIGQVNEALRIVNIELTSRQRGNARRINQEYIQYLQRLLTQNSIPFLERQKYLNLKLEQDALGIIKRESESELMNHD